MHNQLRWYATAVLILSPLFWVGTAATTARPARPAVLVVHNANVLTVDDKNTRATAFAVADGRFIAVGSFKDVRAHIGPGTRVIDLKGKTVLPGFIDAHLHPAPLYDEDSPWTSVDLAPPAVKTMDALTQALKQRAAKTAKGVWVRGARFNDTLLGRYPTRHDLDKASTDHPILISHSSGHVSVCNSYALTHAKVDRNTPDPRGGELGRDDKGEPNGVLKESAASLVRRVGKNPPAPPRDEVIAGYRRRFQEYFMKGITSIHVAGTSTRAAELMSLASTEEAPMHVYVMLTPDEIDDAVQYAKMPPKNPRIRFGPIKFFHGASLSGQTCWLSKPYVNKPGYYGIRPTRSQEKLNELVLEIHSAGLQGCVHSNGDREIDMVLTAYETALTRLPRANHRHRIEHCSVVTEDLLKRIKKLGLVIAPHSYIFEHGAALDAYGEARWEWMFANRTMIEMGIPVAGNSDSPVSAADPLLRIQSMATRRCEYNGKTYGPRQRTTVEQAIAAFTRGGAFASFEEKNRGSIEPGKQADFLILASDPTKVAVDRIRTIKIETTAIAGKVVVGTKLFDEPAAPRGARLRRELDLALVSTASGGNYRRLSEHLGGDFSGTGK